MVILAARVTVKLRRVHHLEETTLIAKWIKMVYLPSSSEENPRVGKQVGTWWMQALTKMPTIQNVQELLGSLDFPLIAQERIAHSASTCLKYFARGLNFQRHVQTLGSAISNGPTLSAQENKGWTAEICITGVDFSENLNKN